MVDFLCLCDLVLKYTIDQIKPLAMGIQVIAKGANSFLASESRECPILLQNSETIPLRKKDTVSI